MVRDHSGRNTRPGEAAVPQHIAWSESPSTTSPGCVATVRSWRGWLPAGLLVPRPADGAGRYPQGDGEGARPAGHPADRAAEVLVAVSEACAKALHAFPGSAGR